VPSPPCLYYTQALACGVFIMSDSSTKFSEEVMGMRAPEVSNSSLSALAQSAVDLVEKDGCSLTTAICKTASQDSSLSSEHLRRITEMANTTTHLRQLNGGENYPVFDLADYRDVWKNMEKTSSVAVKRTTPRSSDFLTAPKQKIAGVFSGVKALGGLIVNDTHSDDLDRAFKAYHKSTGKPVESMSLEDVHHWVGKTKKSEVDELSKEAAVNQLMNTALTLREAHQQLQEQADYYEGLSTVARIKLASEIRTHLLNEGAIEDVAALTMQGGKWEKVAFAQAVALLEDGEKKKVAFELGEVGRALAPVAHLADDAIIMGMQQYNRYERKKDRAKVSSIRIPNPEHPLSKALLSAAELEKQATVYGIAARKTSKANIYSQELLSKAGDL
jgi:hypothetical protein